MKKTEVQVGGHYTAKVNDRVVTVRVDAIREVPGYVSGHRSAKTQTVFDVTNTVTGRKTTFRSAVKFRGVAADPKAAKNPYRNVKAESTDEMFLAAKEAQDYPTAVEPDADLASLFASDAANRTPDAELDSSEVEDQPEEVARPFAAGAPTALTPPPSSPAAAAAPAADPADDWTPEEVEEFCHPETTADRLRLEEREVEESLRPFSAGAAAATAAASRGATTSVPKPAPSASTPATAPTNGTSSLHAKLVAAAPQSTQGVPRLTEEQEDILATATELEATREAGRVLVIGAGAGTGKTYTLKQLEDALSGRGQYTAFNSSLVAESKTKFVRASCNTTHSLAFRTVGKRFAHRLNGPRVQSWVIAKTLGLETLEVPMGEDDKGEPVTKKLSATFLAGQLMVAIRKFCQSADREIAGHHFRYIDGIDTPDPEKGRTYANNTLVREYLLPFAAAAWADLSSPEGTLPFNHDVYVKVWQLGTGDARPVIAADYILIDEYQDTAPVFLDILQQQTHALLVFVGDDNQRIYEWRGAVNAADYFPDAPRRLLSQSFRFGQVIADVANSILRTLETPTDLVMKGLASIPSRVAEVAAPACYLYRTNAGAVGCLLQGFKEGKRGHLIGGGADTVAFVKAARDLQSGKPTSHPELACFANWQEVIAYSELDEGEDLRLMVKLIKTFGVEEILESLEAMPEEKDADFTVSTAHKSKGREWDTVQLGGDFPVVTKMADSDRRLLYVAATRARLVLDISKCPTFCGGYDSRDTGNAERSGAWIPGLEIRYTVLMPTEDDVEAYVEQKAVAYVNKLEREKLEKNPHRYDHQATGVTDNTGPANGSPARVTRTVVEGDFGWTKWNDKWCVRGPAGMEGRTVKVTKKNGNSSEETLTKVLRDFPEATIYAVADGR